MTEREAFEAQAELVGLETFLLGSTQTYAAPPTRVAWLLWQESRMQALEEAATVCDEMQEHYAAVKDTALLNGDVELSNAASGEPRAAEFLATAIRSLSQPTGGKD